MDDVPCFRNGKDALALAMPRGAEPGVCQDQPEGVLDTLTHEIGRPRIIVTDPCKRF